MTSIKILHVSALAFLCSRRLPEDGGPGSSVGIATDYGMDGPGSNPGGDETFRPPDWPWDPPSLL